MFYIKKIVPETSFTAISGEVTAFLEALEKRVGEVFISDSSREVLTASFNLSVGAVMYSIVIRKDLPRIVKATDMRGEALYFEEPFYAWSVEALFAAMQNGMTHVISSLRSQEEKWRKSIEDLQVS